MAQKIIPIMALVNSMTQAEEDAFALTVIGQPAYKCMLYNSTLARTRIWNGTAFETVELLNNDGSVNASNNIKFFNQSSSTIVTKAMVFNVNPSTSNGYSIDISAGGFTSVLGYSITAIRNTSTATSSPNVSVKTVSTSAIVVNIVESSTNLVTLLATSVLSGAPAVFANITGLSLNVVVFGN